MSTAIGKKSITNIHVYTYVYTCLCISVYVWVCMCAHKTHTHFFIYIRISYRRIPSLRKDKWLAQRHTACVVSVRAGIWMQISNPKCMFWPSHETWNILASPLVTDGYGVSAFPAREQWHKPPMSEGCAARSIKRNTTETEPHLGPAVPPWWDQEVLSPSQVSASAVRLGFAKIDIHSLCYQTYHQRIKQILPSWILTAPWTNTSLFFLIKVLHR